jgi:hypothetical protein
MIGDEVIDMVDAEMSGDEIGRAIDGRSRRIEPESLRTKESVHQGKFNAEVAE